MPRGILARPALVALVLLTLSATPAPPIVPRAVALAAGGLARVVDAEGVTVALAYPVSNAQYLSAAAPVETAGAMRLAFRNGETVPVTRQIPDVPTGLVLLVVAGHPGTMSSIASAERPLFGRRLYAPQVSGARWAWAVGWAWSVKDDWLRTDHEPALLYPGTPLFTADGRLAGVALFRGEPEDPISEEDGMLMIGPTGPVTVAVGPEGLQTALARLQASIQ